MTNGRISKVTTGYLLMICVCLVAMMFVANPEAATIVPSDANAVPSALRCPDGRIPLNSPQARCRSQPQLQWAGRRCENDSLDFSCPHGYDCLAEGICCEPPQLPQPQVHLCRMSRSGSKAVDIVGSCSANSDCKGYDSLASRCCSGSCVLLKQRCFRQRRQYQSILSTGQVPRIYLPNCTDDGAFESVQWEPRFNRRWCVDQRTGLALRSGCCLAGNSRPACSNPRPCPPELCALSVCPARPDAVCRVNVCGDGDCRAEFFDPASGQPVDCGAGLGRCRAGQAAYFEGLAYLRARDQTQWLQTDAINKPATSDRNLAAYMDTCEQDECRAYSASLLEPAAFGFGSFKKEDCPKQNDLNYHCRNRCNAFSGCPTESQVCCNSGCGLECMSPADIKPESHCSMSISSGHCPAVGCYRMCRRWGYDVAKKVCRPFWYAGSGGNNNRYNSWAECEWMAQNCHGRVRIALPVRPLCKRRTGNFENVQVSDNGMFWCVDRNGVPTPGTLHADHIACTRDGRLIINKYYLKVAHLYKARCPNGKLPAWCHNRTIDRTCGSPGVATFADACDNCRLVHINANGQEVSCQTDSDVCAASSISSSTAGGPSLIACKSMPTTPNFRYSPSTGRCSAGCPVSGASGYSREAGCLSACARGWCGRNSTAFYPDLCVSPACPSWPGALCVPDECTGSERYFLRNGTEIAACARRLAALHPNDNCSSSATSTTTPSGRAADAQELPQTQRPPQRREAAGVRLDCADLDCATLDCATLDCATLDPDRDYNSDQRSANNNDTAAAKEDSAYLLGPAPSGRREDEVPGLGRPLRSEAMQPDSLLLRGVRQRRRAPGPEAAIVETTNLSVTITYGADYMSVLPTMEDEVKMQRIVAKRFAYEGNLQAHHIRLVDLEPGSILVTVGMQKSPGDSTADLPASAFELKTMALKQTLLIDFNGVTLAPSARQSFNENFDSSIVEPPTAAPLFRGNSDSGAPLNVVGIVVGVLITVAVVAVAAVLITFALRRRAQSGSPALPHESGNYETMSNASHSTAGGGVAYDNFANKVYGPMEDDVYDNIAQPAIQRQLLLLEEGRLRLAEETGLLAGRAGRRKAEKFLNLALGALVAKIGGAGVFALLQPAALLINFISELFILLGTIDQKPAWRLCKLRN
uniref:WAP domain-containing protein n=1 Tax=Macrostomum lignano TaxID=282301 RepID=A0A1I8H267_9PLAT